MTGVSQPRTALGSGREPGRHVVVLGAALALSAVAFDLSLAGELTMFFDLAFITLCLALALAVKPHDFFTVGVLPPLLMAGTFALLGGIRPASIGAAGDGVLQATISGLAHHSAALVAGYVLCLGTLALRRRRLGLPLEARLVVEEDAAERGAPPVGGAYEEPLTSAESADPTGFVAVSDARPGDAGPDETVGQAGSNRLASPAP